MGSRSLVSPSPDPLIWPGMFHSALFLMMAWVLPPSPRFPPLDSSRSHSSELSPRLLPCLPTSTLVDPRTFLEAMTEALHSSPEVTLDKLRTLMPVTVH